MISKQDILDRAAEWGLRPDIVEKVRPRRNRLGGDTFEARLGYRGPLSPPSEAKVRFDLTRHEVVALPLVRRTVFHPYPDELPTDALVPCYALEELLAEKTRALVERTRPRDLYDVVLVLENHRDDIHLPQVREVFRRKCVAKGLVVPSRPEVVALAQASAELASEWSNMLAHQKAFNVDKLRTVRVTESPFVPRYRVEFTA